MRSPRCSKIGGVDPGRRRVACLRAMPAASLHCCVMSPPYGACATTACRRKSGGDSACRHRWADRDRSIDKTNGSATAKLAFNKQSRYSRAETAFCARCGAWRGSLGLEPDYRLYVDHLVEVMREVRPCCAPTASLWLNLGDSTPAPASKRAGRRDDPAAVGKGVLTTQPNVCGSRGSSRRTSSAFRGASPSHCRTTAGGCAATMSGQREPDAGIGARPLHDGARILVFADQIGPR